MIVFDLKCANSHQFEGWFEDSNAFEEQKNNGLISCPVCNEVKIEKVPSGFAIKSSPDKPKNVPIDRAGIQKIAAQKMAEYIEKSFDDVGNEFANEALKMHYGVSEPRNIKGISTKEEEKTLKREGIEFFKVPMSDHPKKTDDLPCGN